VLETDCGFAIDQQVTDDAAREFVAAVASLDD
jgi:hypothetical protein